MRRGGAALAAPTACNSRLRANPCRAPASDRQHTYSPLSAVAHVAHRHRRRPWLQTAAAQGSSSSSSSSSAAAGDAAALAAAGISLDAVSEAAGSQLQQEQLQHPAEQQQHQQQTSSEQQHTQQGAPAAAATTALAEQQQLDKGGEAVQQDGSALQEQKQQQRRPWQLPAVPWALNTTITLMVVWLLCFWLAAYTLVPALLRLTGVEAAAASSVGTAGAAAAAAWTQAVRHLVLDSLQVAATVLLLRRGLSGYHPRQLGLFAAPLRPLRRWLPAVAAGVATFPFIDWVHKRMVTLLSMDDGSVVR